METWGFVLLEFAAPRSEIWSYLWISIVQGSFRGPGDLIHPLKGHPYGFLDLRLTKNGPELAEQWKISCFTRDGTGKSFEQAGFYGFFLGYLHTTNKNEMVLSVY